MAKQFQELTKDESSHTGSLEGQAFFTRSSKDLFQNIGSVLALSLSFGFPNLSEASFPKSENPINTKVNEVWRSTLLPANVCDGAFQILESPDLSYMVANAQAGKSVYSFVYWGDTQRALVQEMVAYLEVNSPNDARSQIQWQTYASLLRGQASERYKLYEPSVGPNLQSFIASTNRWLESDDPYNEMDRNLRALHVLATVVRPDDVSLCFDQIKLLEEDLFNRYGVKIEDQIRSDAAYVRANSASNNQEWRDNALNVLEQDVDWNALNSHFEKDGDRRVIRVCGGDENETWEFGASDKWRPEGPEGVMFRRVDKPGAVLHMAGPCGLAAVKNGNIDCLLIDCSQQYEKARSSENLAKISQFNFPTNEKLAHLRFAPMYADAVIDSTLLASMAHVWALKKRYGDNLIAPPIIFSMNPMEDIRNVIPDLYSKGVRNFTIDLSNHGSKSSIEFSHAVNIDALRKLVKEYPDCKFFWESIACYGGGCVGQMQTISDVEDRKGLYIAVQTKSHNVNKVIQVSDRRDITQYDSAHYRGSYYTAIRDLNLLDPELSTLGQVILQTDSECSAVTPLDPETIIDGELFTEINAHNLGLVAKAD